MTGALKVGNTSVQRYLEVFRPFHCVHFSAFSLLLFYYSQTRSSVNPQESVNEFIIQKLNPLLVVDFRLTPVTGTTNGFIFQIINSLIESWGGRLDLV